jgi:hypothetical protein
MKGVSEMLTTKAAVIDKAAECGIEVKEKLGYAAPITASIREKLGRSVKVFRFELVAFMVNEFRDTPRSKPYGFSKLPALSGNELSAESRFANNPTGWIIPAAALGKSDPKSDSARENVRRWLEDRLIPAMREVCPELLSDKPAVMLTDNGVTIYRRKASENGQ